MRHRCVVVFGIPAWVRMAACLVVLTITLEAHAQVDPSPDDAGVGDAVAIPASTLDNALEPVSEPAVQEPPPPTPSIEYSSPYEAATPPPRLSLRCGVAPYLEHSLMLVAADHNTSPPSGFGPRPSVSGSYVSRFGLGATIRRCPGGQPGLHVRVGAAGSLGNLNQEDSDPLLRLFPYGIGIGGELEIGSALGTMSRLGGRFGVEAASRGRAIFTLGVRARYRDSAWVGIDAFHITRSHVEPSCEDKAVPGCSYTTSGVMVGIGGDGRYGLLAAGIHVSLYLTLFALFVVAESGDCGEGC